MSRFLTQKDDGTYLQEIESMEVCRWRIDDICVNDKCEYVADYPYPSEMCYINTKNRCEYFEKESDNK